MTIFFFNIIYCRLCSLHISIYKLPLFPCSDGAWKNWIVRCPGRRTGKKRNYATFKRAHRAHDCKQMGCFSWSFSFHMHNRISLILRLLRPFTYNKLELLWRLSVLFLVLLTVNWYVVCNLIILMLLGVLWLILEQSCIIWKIGYWTEWAM